MRGPLTLIREAWYRFFFYMKCLGESDLVDCCIVVVVICWIILVFLGLTFCFTSKWFARWLGQS